MRSQEFQKDQMEDSVDDAQKKKSKGGSGAIWFVLVVVVVIAAMVVMSSNKSSVGEPSSAVITTSPRTENRVPVRRDAAQWQTPRRRTTRQAFPPPINEVKNFRGASTRKPGN